MEKKRRDKEKRGKEKRKEGDRGDWRKETRKEEEGKYHQSRSHNSIFECCVDHIERIVERMDHDGLEALHKHPLLGILS
jgi:hypothetical protein